MTDLFKELDERRAKELAELLSPKWAVGFKDRGMGHGDYGVITVGGKLIVECPRKEVAEHIVTLHNKELKNGSKEKTKGQRGRKRTPSDRKSRKR